MTGFGEVASLVWRTLFQGYLVEPRRPGERGSMPRKPKDSRILGVKWWAGQQASCLLSLGLGRHEDSWRGKLALPLCVLERERKKRALALYFEASCFGVSAGVDQHTCQLLSAVFGVPSLA